jgi:hypothetical protein
MADLPRAPRIWIDVEQGATFGDPADTLAIFREITAVLAPVREVWLFAGIDAPLIRGFRHPRSLHERYGVPLGRGPGMVLIDGDGDQLWLSGASCDAGGAASAATAILGELGLTDAVASAIAAPRTDARSARGAGPPTESGAPAAAVTSPAELLTSLDELHLIDGIVVGHRLAGAPTPPAPPGRTFVRRHRLVTRMEFDKGGVTATDLRSLWALSTEPHGWLAEPTSLTLYETRLRSEESGHDGCQLVAVGASGRELWMQFPEADEFDRVAAGRRRQRYEGSYSEWEAAREWIFTSVGADITSAGDRSLRDKLLGRHHAPPAVLHWP